MKAEHAEYDLIKSIERIDEILSTSDSSYADHSGVPSIEQLTFTNGYYVSVTILFIDIRGSKELSKSQTKPVLAKIYRAYISEVIAMIRSDATISEIFIEGDGIWAVFNTTTSAQVNSVFNTAARVASLIDLLNNKFIKKGYPEISVGIGLDDGEALCIKTGLKTSGVNEVVWIGEVVGKAASLCSKGNRTAFDYEFMVSDQVYRNLSEYNKGLLKWHPTNGCWCEDIVNIAMNNWLNTYGK